jgi:hypothetical protein
VGIYILYLYISSYYVQIAYFVGKGQGMVRIKEVFSIAIKTSYSAEENLAFFLFFPLPTCPVPGL